MKRQESSISSNKNRGLKYALCIITLLCCLLSTIVQAENITANNLRTISLYGLQSIDATTNTWHTISFTKENDKITGTFQSMSQYRIALIFNFDSIKVENLYIKYKMKINNSNIGTGTNYVRMQNNGSTLFDWNINVEKSNNVYTISTTQTATNKFDTTGFTTFVNISYVSSTIEIYDIEIIINDESYSITSKWEEKQHELEEALQDIEVTVDQNAIDDIINNPPTIDSTINVGIFNFTNETIPLYIMSLTLSLAIISFLLYGKK